MADSVSVWVTILSFVLNIVHCCMFEGMNTFQSAVQTVGFLFFFCLFVCFYLTLIPLRESLLDGF